MAFSIWRFMHILFDTSWIFCLTLHACSVLHFIHILFYSSCILCLTLYACSVLHFMHNLFYPSCMFCFTLHAYSVLHFMHILFYILCIFIASVDDNLSSATAVTGYAIDLRRMAANRQFIIDAQMTVSFLCFWVCVCVCALLGICIKASPVVSLLINVT